MIFEPLSCTALERFFIEDGKAGSDAVGHMVFEIGRTSDRQLLSESFRLTSRRHPLLHARVRFLEINRAVWEFHDEPVLFFDEPAFLHYFDSSGQLDIETHSGVKFLAQTGSDFTTIHVRFHHAACDGLALINVLKEWMTAYRAMEKGDHPKEGDLDPSLLAGRGQSRWRQPQRVNRAMSIWNLWTQGIRWLRTQSIPITPSNSLPRNLRLTDQKSLLDQSTPLSLRDKANWHHLESSVVMLSASETEHLKSQAIKQGVMLNDLILCELHLLLSRQAAASREIFHGRNHSIRISLPNSLRKSQDRVLPACNVLGFAFVDMQPDANMRFDDLLQFISRRTREIRRWNGGQMFLDGLALLQGWPSLFKRVLRGNRCFASAVYSSVGQVEQIDSDLLSVRGKPPLRRKTHIAVFSALVRNQLILTLSTAPTIFTTNQRQNLLHDFSNALKLRTERMPLDD